jgi:hypothetical protein
MSYVKRNREKITKRVKILRYIHRISELDKQRDELIAQLELEVLSSSVYTEQWRTAL